MVTYFGNGARRASTYYEYTEVHPTATDNAEAITEALESEGWKTHMTTMDRDRNITKITYRRKTV